MEKLTLQRLKEMKPDSIFASGITVDNETGINMSRSDKELCWVAVRGGIWDWAIYIYYSSYTEDYIKRCGDKVTFESHIKKLVPCDDEAFKMYRY